MVFETAYINSFKMVHIYRLFALKCAHVTCYVIILVKVSATEEGHCKEHMYNQKPICSRDK